MVVVVVILWWFPAGSLLCYLTQGNTGPDGDDATETSSFFDLSEGGGALVGDDDDAQSTDFMDAAFRDYQRMQDDDDDEDDFVPEPIATGGIPSDKGFDDATRGGVAHALAMMEQQNERYQFEVRGHLTPQFGFGEALVT